MVAQEVTNTMALPLVMQQHDIAMQMVHTKVDWQEFPIALRSTVTQQAEIRYGQTYRKTIRLPICF